MKSFKLSDEYEVVCVSEGTRYGFITFEELHKLKMLGELEKDGI